MGKAAVGITFLLLLAVDPVSIAVQRPSTLPPESIAKIEALVTASISESKTPGLSLAIVKDKQIRYAKGFGMADLENSVPAKSGTVYRIGSLSKTITATAVMQLSEKGKLDLDAPIQKYCPAFPTKQWPVTARQLLAHLGGVRDYSNQKFLEEYFSTRHYSSVTEALDIFKDDPLVQEPGTKYLYSTYGYNVLGCAIEGASSLKYDDYVSANILKVAGMETTTLDDIFEIIPNRSRGYRKTREGRVTNTLYADTSNKIPAGGFVSTAEDMCKFAVALQNGSLINETTLQQMWTLQKTRDGQQISYGLGWRIGNRNGSKEVFHGGAAAGFSTFLYCLPEKGVSVVLMANMELLGQKQRDDLAREIADIVAR
jgi:CubicO group peptidase (beta-lactamase class C family)